MPTRRCTPGRRCGCSRSTALDRRRLPRPGCSTSCSSTSPGGSTGRTPRATTCSRAASSASTTSARSTGASRCPVPGVLEQSDGSGWMAMYCLNLLDMALILGEHDPAYEDIAVKFVEHFAFIASAMNESGLWDEDDRLFYDVVRRPDGSIRAGPGPLDGRGDPDGGGVGRARAPGGPRCRSSPSGSSGSSATARGGRIGLGQPRRRPATSGRCCCRWSRPIGCAGCCRVLDEDEFLSPHGLRSLSRWHLEPPATVDLDGVSSTVDYEPAESRSGLFGGNSNWRGPVWFPVNYLVIEALVRLPRRSSATTFTVEFPTGSGSEVPLDEVADGLARRLISLFTDDADGRRPAFGRLRAAADRPRLARPAAGSTSTSTATPAPGSAPSHQTGWTALVAHLIALRRYT